MFFDKKKEKEINLLLKPPASPPIKSPNLLLFYEPEHQFIFEKNTELLKDLQGYIQKFLSNSNDFFFIHRSFPEKILKDLIYLKEYQQNISEKEENFNLMVKNYAILTQQIANQDSIIKQIENTYMDKINDLRIEVSRLSELLEQNNEEKLKNDEKLENENNEIQKKFLEEIEKSNKFLELFKETVKENTVLKEEIALLKKNLKFFTIGEKEEKIVKKIAIEDVLKSSIFFEISKFLEIGDIFALQRTNKSIYFVVGLNSKLLKTITMIFHEKYSKKADYLERKLNFSMKIYEEIPDEYLKSSIMKFLFLDFKIGDLMPAILKKSQILIEKDISHFKEETSNFHNFIEIFEQNPSQKLENSFIEFEEKSKETTAFEELSSKTLNCEKTKLEETDKSKNFFQKFFSKSKENPQKTEEKLQEIVKEKRKIVDKLNIEAIAKCLQNLAITNEITINQDFLKNFEKENANFKSKIEQQMKNLQKKIFSKIIEYTNEENNEKLDDFFKEFVKNFSEMILFSSILLQEAKELESIKDFLLACNDKAQIELFNLKDKLEDMQMEISTEKKLKEFLSGKSKDLEKKIHENDSLIYKNNEMILTLNNQINSLESKIKEINEEKLDQKNKTKTLASEVKNLRNKNQELETNLKNLINDCLEIKIQFEKIPMEV